MFIKHKGCKKETICGVDHWVPPVGKGINVITGELEDVETLCRSTKKQDQFWFRTPLPTDWNKKRQLEEDRKKTNNEFVDPELEGFRVQEWHRRLNGLWVMMNGKPVYITGLHYFYLNWWNIGVYPNFREPDRKFFYFALYCQLDPDCLGLIEITKRKSGKTARAGCWQYEHISRTKSVDGGIQSKTGADAQKNVFQKYTIRPFKKLPDFFKPIYDTTKGETPSSELSFFRPNRKGQYSGTDTREELESKIDWRTSDKFSYDSQVLARYICDEAGKFVEVDVYDLHMVARFTCEIDAEFKGKMLYTTTVEEMESGGKGFSRLVNASNQLKKEKNGRTQSGLYTFFTPAYETLYYDDFGQPDVEKAKKYYLDQRDALESDPFALNAYIRKNPFTLHDCFRIDNEHAMFDPIKLGNRMNTLEFMDSPYTQGNFMWKDGIRDTEVVFKPMKTGRWQVSWLFDDPKSANNCFKKGGILYPGNGLKFITGIDPYDHDVTVDNRRSDGAGLTKMKFDASRADKFPNNAFVCYYRARPKTAKLFYEDMIMQCHYFGSPMLFETQKIGIKNYFIDRGYGEFMVYIPGNDEPGVAASKNVHQQIAELTEDYIENQLHKVNFKDLIQDWITFDINHTTKFDATMAAGYALIGDMVIVLRAPEPVVEATEIFRRRTVPAMH